MSWHPANRYTEVHASGGSVCACRTANGWRFSAWAPKAMPDASVWAWHEAHCATVTRAQGDRTPQRVECLGVRDTADQARALVERLAVDASA